ncbi:hypothetical protein [Nitrososphaera viennensis]|uniref:Uncharacterized protein n=2 Tax=Nitrososphaera viennensis TaxID=1034015 RepID=A0A060HKR8_9ARCH|nr:hypothetical protein [Nitrososphaera viennensis]AIC16078.1 hypothetical protein NVIE_018230 [Nitrososphaera viennensis EN76]UVS68046.1 hypothetical protein NWT39_09040 [Nitrososphaera viennensis]
MKLKIKAFAINGHGCNVLQRDLFKPEGVNNFSTDAKSEKEERKRREGSRAAFFAVLSMHQVMFGNTIT